MNIVHFILGKANPDRANGVNQVIYGLAKYQTLQGNKVWVIGLSKSMKEEYEIIQRDYFTVYAYRSFKKGCLSKIESIIDVVDIVHMHGVWNIYNVKLGEYLRTKGKPYVITAHCGYAEDRLKQSNYLLKMLFHKFLQKKLYEKASGVHALTREESTEIAKYISNNNIFVVNNGVDSMTYDKYHYKIHENRKIIKFGYLGRLSVEKNLTNLIRSFSLLPDACKCIVELHLIGPKSNEIDDLKKLVHKCELDDIVKFDGGKFGQEKIDALLDLDVYIHPAYSDVVGIAVMEALALGLPTIVTRTSHMSYFCQSNAFIMVEPTDFDICRGVKFIVENKNKWLDYSNNAKRLYKNRFNWESVVELLSLEYNSILQQRR